MRGAALAAGAALLVGCAAPAVVPVPGPAVTLDPATGTAETAGGGLALAVRPSAWRGSPRDLGLVVTPFHVRLANGASAPVAYAIDGFRLFDDTRYQYPALAPAEVALRYLSADEPPVRLAAADAPRVGRRRVIPGPVGWWGVWGWGPWWGPTWGPWWDPYLYRPPSVADVYQLALPDGPLAAGARVEGFVYFARLRPEVRHLVLEFEHRLGEAPGRLTLPFDVRRGAADVRGSAA